MTIARALGELDPWIATAAARYKKEETWFQHGFARMEDHCREVFHRSSRWVRDLATLGRAFKDAEKLQAAFKGSDGGVPLGRCRAVLIARVATPSNLSGWIKLARRCSVDELKRHVRLTRESGSEPPEVAPFRTQRPVPEPADDRRIIDDEEPDTTERCRLTLQLPFPVAVAFDEGLELFRVVKGEESTVTSYIEALVAEQIASGWGGDHDVTELPGVERSPGSQWESGRTGRAAGPAGAGDDGAGGAEGGHLGAVGGGVGGAESGPTDVGGTGQEADLAGSLPRLGDEPTAIERAEWALVRFAAARGSLATGGNADPADQIEALVHLEEELEGQLGEVLLTIAELRGWRRLNFKGTGHYAEERLGVSRSWAEDRVRAARSLRRFPRLRESYEKGAIGLEALLKVSAVLKHAPNPDEVVDAWVERASECTVKRLRDESRELTRRRAGLFAGYGQEAAARRAPLDDFSWFRSLERRAGTARLRIQQLTEMAIARPVADTPLVLRLPEEIAATFLSALRTAQSRAASAYPTVLAHGDGASAAVAGTVSETNDGPACPCRTFSTAEDEASGRAGGPASDGTACPCRTFSTAEAAHRRATPDSNRPCCPCRTFSTAEAQEQLPPVWAALLVLIEDFVSTNDNNENDPKRPRHNNEALIAFGWRCAAPGCTSRRLLQVHHVIYRSHGGGNERENLVVLCLFHHVRGEHGDLAACRGRVPLGISWRLGTRDRARHYRNERRVRQHIPRGL